MHWTLPWGAQGAQAAKLPYDDVNHTNTISLLYHGTKEAFAALPDFPAPSPWVHYRIGDVPGAEKGRFVLIDLDTGLSRQPFPPPITSQLH